MKHKERYDHLTASGVITPDYEDVITSLVNRLIESLYKPDEELQFITDAKRIKLFGLENEPVNWGSLRCNEVKQFEDGSFLVTIDEACPGHCQMLCEYIEKFMAAWGWQIKVVTEW